MSRPAERRLVTAQYRKIPVGGFRWAGVTFDVKIDDAEQAGLVPPEIIVAIIGVDGGQGNLDETVQYACF